MQALTNSTHTLQRLELAFNIRLGSRSPDAQAMAWHPLSQFTNLNTKQLNPSNIGSAMFEALTSLRQFQTLRLYCHISPKACDPLLLSSMVRSPSWCSLHLHILKDTYKFHRLRRKDQGLATFMPIPAEGVDERAAQRIRVVAHKEDKSHSFGIRVGDNGKQEWSLISKR
jgi:hypothetical protein